MPNLNWIRDNNGNWLDPRNTDWAFISYVGVYTIWVPGTGFSGPSFIKVGQGDVKDRMQSHMRDLRIARFPNLRFTYASVSWYERDGVERYLGEVLRPLVAERFPDAPPIRVNLPLVA